MAFIHARDGDSDKAGKVEITAQILRDDRPAAILVDDGVKQFWLPRKSVTVTPIGSKHGFAEILMPMWLAKSKGCV